MSTLDRSANGFRYLELEDPFAKPAGTLDVNKLPLSQVDDDDDEVDDDGEGSGPGGSGAGNDKEPPMSVLSNSF